MADSELLPKQDREGTFLGITRSVCPTCRKIIDAQLVSRGRQVVMRKWCGEHGWFESLVANDVERYVAQRRFNKPGTIPHHFEREFHGCPDSCGLCPEHQQHTCLGIIDVTDSCNLRCPVCFADAEAGGRHLSLAQIGDMLDRLKRCEGNPEVIQLSGGEPTLHPEIVDIVRLCRDKGYDKILLNTNGIRLAKEDRLLDALAELDPTFYLQFDGFDPETYRRIRGEDLSELKLRVVERLAARRQRTVLVATLVRGINDDELGALTDFALDQEWVRCLNIQPVTYAGRFEAGARDGLDRITLGEIAERIADQSGYGLRVDDFFPIPCPDPSCSLATYIHKVGDEVRPLPRLVDIDDYLDYIKNVSVVQLTDRIRVALEGLFSMSAVPGEETSKSFCTACSVELDWGAIESEITMISMMHFMDEENFDLARSKKCCVHQILPDDGGIIPFCNYNVLHRGRSA